MNLQIQWKIFIAMARANVLGYGGGPATIPLVHKEIVEKYRWMDDEEFTEVVALGNTLPGPIITKLCGYVGYRVGGIVGMINAVLATVMPTAIIMLILVGTLTTFRETPIVQGMTNAIMPIVGVLLLSLTYNFLKQSTQKSGFFLTIVLTVISLLLFEWLNLHPAILIVSLIAIAFAQKPKPQPARKEEA
ncbi:chromate transporter [Geomicrobium sp. JCM 19037]|uniref:chromate transporter n=1 Tax=Geomicrobium sp. JCM 19037 TaxID=1460634 RepID=UPI00045F3D77|nr:chromate transporter [Geomicrobium sp. JCM 19037]GAK05939.1 chromate transporter [Geomicrobium sp. JCM 19037]